MAKYKWPPVPEPIADSMLREARAILVAERKRLKIRSMDLATYCDVTQPHMTSLEKGRVIPSHRVWMAWCEAIGYKPEMILKKNTGVPRLPTLPRLAPPMTPKYGKKRRK